MKVVHCPCGADLRGETDDELVANVELHIEDVHPDLIGTMSRKQILDLVHEH